MPVIPFGEYLPDGPSFANPGTVTALNCVPRTQSTYGPMLGPMPYGSALPAQVCGSYGYRDGSFTAYNFAATQGHIYLQKTGSQTYSDVSGTTAPYHTETPFDGYWSSTSFGNLIVFTNYDDPVQCFLAGTDAKFSDLAAAAPRARFAAVIKDFLVLANTSDAVDGAVPFRLHWSAIGAPKSWPTPGTQAAISVLRDFQDLQQTDLGAITGLVGGHLSAADGCAIMSKGLYRIAFAGSPAIFDFAVAEGAAGSDSPQSIVQRRIPDSTGQVRSVIYYLSSDGFAAFDGNSSSPIGAQKVDRTFFNDLDPQYLRAVHGTYDATRKLIFFFYHGTQNNGLFNRALVYNWELNRWTLVDLTPFPAEWVADAGYSTGGYNLEQLDQFGNLDQLKFSLDSRQWTQSNQLSLSWFDGSHQQQFASGPSLPCTIATPEMQMFPGKRARIISARPMTDGTGVQIAVGTRENVQQTGVTYRLSVPVNIIGECPQRSTGRYVRLQVTLPQAANFNHLMGVDVTARPEGFR